MAQQTWSPNIAPSIRRGAWTLAQRLVDARGGLMAIAVVIGLVVGLGAIAFRWLITTLTYAFTGHEDYAGLGRVGNPHIPWLGPWFVLVAPVIAGLIYGPLVYRFAREARGHGVPEVMFAVARRGGRIPGRVATVKALASALCISGGGSVGREGPIVQIGSSLGSSVGRMVGASEGRLRILVAAGAASGIAATFNAPLAGVFFAMELILLDFAAGAFGVVVIASVTASIVGRAAFGDVPFLRLPEFTVQHWGEYALFALLGILAGAIGVAFSRILYLVEDLCDAVWRGPEWLRPAVGGLVLGGLLLALPEMYGVGYPVLEDAIGGRYVWTFLLVLLVGKMLATSLTIGIGGSGGVFAPSLFIGAAFGAAFGAFADALIPTASPVGAYGLIGMGAVFAGAARAPITAVVIMFELTNEYSIILPLMAAIVLATVTSRALSADTIYTRKLLRRGVDIMAPAPGPLEAAKVADLMVDLPVPIRASASLEHAAAELAVSADGVLPVLDDDGDFIGTVSARSVAQALVDDVDAPLADLVQLPPRIVPSHSVSKAVAALTEITGAALPVVADDGERLVGWLSYTHVFGHLRPGPTGTRR